jgi:hypothetical protein
MPAIEWARTVTNVDHDPASLHCVTWLQPQETNPDVCLTPIEPADNPCQLTNAACMLTRTGSSEYDANAS